jgi:hypothetical protein
MRPVVITLQYICASSFRREVSEVSQVEQEGATVCLFLVRPALPVLTGVTTNTITILDLKYTHRFALVVTAWVEVFVFPTMKEATVKKARLQAPVPQQLQKEQPHFVADLAAGVGQEGLYHCYFNVKGSIHSLFSLMLFIMILDCLNSFYRSFKLCIRYFSPQVKYSSLDCTEYSAYRIHFLLYLCLCFLSSLSYVLKHVFKWRNFGGFCPL